MKVSVILPAYNTGGYIERAIKSILNQTYTDWELLIIDDCSTDNTGKIVDKYRSEKIKVFHNPINKGVSFSRNVGLDNCTGDYVCFLDSDDTYRPNFIEDDLKLIKDADIIKHFPCVHKQDGKTYLTGGYSETNKVFDSFEYKTFYKEGKYDLCALTGSLFKGELFQKIRFNEKVSMAEDALVWLELLCQGCKIYMSDSIVYDYYRRPKSLSKIGFESPDKVIYFLNNLRNVLNKYPNITEEMYKRFIHYFGEIALRHYHQNHTDVVICYVDGTDPLQKEAFLQARPNHDLPEDYNTRFVPNDTLKYVFRSIEKNLDFNKIIHFVISRESQIPNWLDRNKIHIVYHEDFIPNKFLPTFNPGTIELYLHKIPGLSERFIYFNDDMFVLKRLSVNNFFNNSKIRTNLLKIDFRQTVWCNTFRNAADLVGCKRDGNLYSQPIHWASPLTKSIYNEVWNKYKIQLEESCTIFREDKNINQYVFTDYATVNNLSVPVNVKFQYCDFKNWSKIKNTIKQYHLICVNDNIEDIKDFLKDIFPNSSKYELGWKKKKHNDLYYIYYA